MTVKTQYDIGQKVGPNNITYLGDVQDNIKHDRRFGIFKCPNCYNFFTARINDVVRGKQHSCGCAKYKYCKEDFQDKKFGHLLVTKFFYDEKRHHRASVECQCDCGKRVVKDAGDVLKGRTTTCGYSCPYYVKEKKERLSRDISGQRFGKLIAIRPLYVDKNHGTIWECKCDCGNTAYVGIGPLVTGNTKSCGCLVSYWEEYIAKCLTNLNIDFVRQKTFPECISPNGVRLRFDFYLPAYNCCLEYDGSQHFIPTRHKDALQRLEQIQQYDKTKNCFCNENDIRLIRIPYWDTDKINEQYLLELLTVVNL